MNVFAPVSSIMTTDLIALNPDDSLLMVKEIFDKNNIHHIPIVRHRALLGLISKHDFEHFQIGMSAYDEDRFLNQTILKNHKVKEIMVEKLAKLEPNDHINVALDVFLLNRFHALPVVDDGVLVGILTTHDIIKALVAESTTKAS
ncbi:MAG: CBS domain-containing protein [Saprospiraceae bacterium]|nr:CBS domain-containing protein [Saprospiraceae bacterium]